MINIVHKIRKMSSLFNENEMALLFKLLDKDNGGYIKYQDINMLFEKIYCLRSIVQEVEYGEIREQEGKYTIKEINNMIQFGLKYPS